jgi:hypothetical protein
MNVHMAASAIAASCEAAFAVGDVGRKRIDVTLQTERAFFTPREEKFIYAAVGRMASEAAFHFHRRVFENVGTAFFGVALHAGFPA